MPPTDDTDAPSVDAGFTYNKATYAINRTTFVKYSLLADTPAPYRCIDQGYPKVHTLLALLEELGHSPSAKEQESLSSEKVVAAYEQGTTLYLRTKSGKDYEYKDGKLTLLDSRGGWTAGFVVGDFVYRFAGTQLTITNFTVKTPKPESFTLNHNIHAAFVGMDNQVYLFRKTDFISFPKDGLTGQTVANEVNRAIAWNNALVNSAKWGKVGDNIAYTGKIDAAFCDGEKTYLFSGDEYSAYSGSTYPPDRASYPDSGYPKKLTTNMERFPKWDKIDAILQTFTPEGNKGELFFFRHAEKDYTSSTDLRGRNDTAAKWGRVRNNIAAQGIVDAAFVKQDCLFLASGDQIFRYTLRDSASTTPGPDPSLNEFVDMGYPKSFKWGEVEAEKTAPADGTLANRTWVDGMLEDDGLAVLVEPPITQIDAAFTLSYTTPLAASDKTYLFTGTRYAHLAELKDKELQELKTDPLLKPIQGNWGTCPRNCCQVWMGRWMR